MRKGPLSLGRGVLGRIPALRRLEEQTWGLPGWRVLEVVVTAAGVEIEAARG